MQAVATLMMIIAETSRSIRTPPFGLTEIAAIAGIVAKPKICAKIARIVRIGLSAWSIDKRDKMMIRPAVISNAVAKVASVRWMRFPSAP
ncbi:hypothetical protein D9M68_689800 [compost metagenome]